MQPIVTAFAALILSASAVHAADLPARNVPVNQQPLPVFSWAGFYAGAQLGAGGQRDRLTETASCATPCASVFTAGRATGILGGIHAGVNWAANALVLGLESDLELTGLDHTTPIPQSEPDSVRSRVSWQGSIRARAGYAIDRLLVYVTGGMALAEIRHAYTLYDGTTLAFQGEQSFSATRPGWTLGGGLEYAFTNTWSGRIEYRYSDFGRQSETPSLFTTPRGITFAEQHRETQQAVRVGVSYRF